MCMFSLVCSDFSSIVCQHYLFLVDNLDAKHSGLVSKLYKADVLSTEEKESINCEMISFAQTEKLLRIISRKTKDQFDKFLDNTGQQHVRNHITGRQRQCFVSVFSLFSVTFYSLVLVV